MKFKRFALATVLLASSVLASCNNRGEDPSGSGASGSIPEGYVRVYYYVDFNQPDTGEYYYAQDYKPGSKIVKPETPEAPDPAFPTFLGWSYKELINTTDDLWDFGKDTLEIDITTQGNKYSIYGIWDIQA